MQLNLLSMVKLVHSPAFCHASKREIHHDIPVVQENGNQAIPRCNLLVYSLPAWASDVGLSEVRVQMWEWMHCNEMFSYVFSCCHFHSSLELLIKLPRIPNTHDPEIHRIPNARKVVKPPLIECPESPEVFYIISNALQTELTSLGCLVTIGPETM